MAKVDARITDRAGFAATAGALAGGDDGDSSELRAAVMAIRESAAGRARGSASASAFSSENGRKVRVTGRAGMPRSAASFKLGSLGVSWDRRGEAVATERVEGARAELEDGPA